MLHPYRCFDPNQDPGPALASAPGRNPSIDDQAPLASRSLMAHSHPGLSHFLKRYLTPHSPGASPATVEPKTSKTGPPERIMVDPIPLTPRTHTGLSHWPLTLPQSLGASPAPHSSCSSLTAAIEPRESLSGIHEFTIKHTDASSVPLPSFPPSSFLPSKCMAALHLHMPQAPCSKPLLQGLHLLRVFTNESDLDLLGPCRRQTRTQPGSLLTACAELDGLQPVRGRDRDLAFSVCACVEADRVAGE